MPGSLTAALRRGRRWARATRARQRGRGRERRRRLHGRGGGGLKKKGEEEKSALLEPWLLAHQGQKGWVGMFAPPVWS